MTAIPIETLVTLSTDLLTQDARDWMANGGFGATVYPNEYGAFMFVGYPHRPDFDRPVPTDVARLAARAWQAGITWLKFDPDGFMPHGATADPWNMVGPASDPPPWLTTRPPPASAVASAAAGWLVTDRQAAADMIDLVLRLDEWRELTGGWDAAVWGQVRQMVLAINFAARTR